MNAATLSRSFAALAAAAASLAISWACFAQSQPAAPRLIAKGYDPVAYFTLGKPTKGDPAISYEWDEGRYHFANAQHRAAFAADPERYAPRFSGYCTGSVSGGAKYPPNEGDPEAWTIVEGKLYLFGSREWQINELPKKPQTFQRAHENWDRRKAQTAG